MYWFLFLGASLFQAVPSTPQTEINSQVWKPFIQHFNSNNTEGFMAVHSKCHPFSTRGKSCLGLGCISNATGYR
jgi:hypothetical protein